MEVECDVLEVADSPHDSLRLEVVDHSRRTCSLRACGGVVEEANSLSVCCTDRSRLYKDYTFVYPQAVVDIFQADVHSSLLQEAGNVLPGAAVVVVKLIAFYHAVVGSCHRPTAAVGTRLKVGIRCSLAVDNSLVPGMAPPNVQPLGQHVHNCPLVDLRQLLSLTLTYVGLETPYNKKRFLLE